MTYEDEQLPHEFIVRETGGLDATPPHVFQDFYFKNTIMLFSLTEGLGASGCSSHVTTGFTLFSESQKRSAKPIRLSAKALPRAALGKDLTAKLCPAKTLLPRANSTTLGKEFAESQLSPRRSKVA
jgi:hypothetical protein